MGARRGRKSARLSKLWSRLSLRRWLSSGPRQTNHSFFMVDEYPQADDTETDLSEDEGFLDFETFEKARHSFSVAELEFHSSIPAPICPPVRARHSSATLMPQDAEILRSKLTEKQQYKIFVATWNVGGKPPNEEVPLEEWLGLEAPADIYVLGFQEVVPLNAGNVLGSENTVPAAKWLHLIRNVLNSTNAPFQNLRRSCSTPSSMWQNTVQENPSSTGQRTGEENITMRDDNASAVNPTSLVETMPSSVAGDTHAALDHFLSNIECWDPFLDEAQIYNMRTSLNCMQVDGDNTHVPCLSPSLSTRSIRCKSSVSKTHFSLIASKQMVGIFISVWVRSDLRRHVRNLKVSCVGCGLLGYLGNKGSISISMCIHQTSICFVCTHLTSGQRDKDELKRNSDVSEILRRTQFRSSSGKYNVHAGGELCPESILEHDSSVIWLGDLNYRLVLPPNDTRSLLAQADWSALLEKDQLNIHRKAGRVFAGWQEGDIAFAPTYKYRANSDCYALEKLKGEKHRTPAWCDRILWYGSGLKQLSYVRAEARHSDHRPVFAIFLAEVEALSRQKLRDFLLLSAAKVQAEELLLLPPNSTHHQVEHEDETRFCEV
ncbi:hypothetical protein GOP47_0020077 [Adiantum capillus-veneris]|uniref:Inositol polyphosphate-related phosphatase domain-containing protein n=1 Tax=Adiantum capillus-veneris TaxID=13818 RepID=A0A9D4UCZ7_ADICA|nr:hypothetical protein GOP47_0020077 [Adiantum capillus-veneris]